MILLSGVPGSGKTRRVLAHLRESGGTLLLVPTATLAQHLRHEMAREAPAFRPGRILTLSKFARQFESQPQVSAPLFQLITGAVLRRLDRPEFARVADTKGLPAAVSRTMLEFDAAGITARQLARALERGHAGEELPPAFAAVWLEVERELRQRGMITRGALLQNAAAKIRMTGLVGVTRVCLDGFAALPAPELDVIAAIAAHAEVIVTLPEAGNSPSIAAARERLLAMGAIQQNLPEPANPLTGYARFCAENIEREVDEIARRILQYCADGVPFRRIGVVTRQREVYQPLLATAFERFGIPARSYAGMPLLDHPPARFVVAVVDALLSGWDHARTIEALRLGSPASAPLDDLEFRARKQYPARGLGALRDLRRGPLRLLDRLGEFDKLAGARLTARKWAAQLDRIRGLRDLGVVPDGLDARGRAVYAAAGHAFDTVEAVLRETADSFDSKRPLSLEEFWAAAREALDAATLRAADNRREAVHLLSAAEVRQWDLDIVFLCGMVEKQFPRKHPQNPLFRDAALLALRAQGLAVRTSEELSLEEHFLFTAALGAARREVLLSYPRLDARGQENTPSQFFGLFQQPVEDCSAVCPAPAPPMPPRPPLSELRNREHASLQRAHFSPSGLEVFQKCPLQYFFSRTLRLEPLPPLPEARLDFLAQGNIVHAVLARWAAERLPVDQLVEEEFDRFCQAQHVPRSYAIEARRLRLRRVLKPFIESYPWPYPDKLRIESAFDLELDAATRIKGRIDLAVLDPEGARIYDYKFSRAKSVVDRLDSPAALQAPIYLRGYESSSGTPVRGVFYIALREGEQYKVAGWGEHNGHSRHVLPLTPAWLEEKMADVRAAIAAIRAGHIGANPRFAQTCSQCDFREACRHQMAAALAVGGEP